MKINQSCFHLVLTLLKNLFDWKVKTQVKTSHHGITTIINKQQPVQQQPAQQQPAQQQPAQQHQHNSNQHNSNQCNNNQLHQQYYINQWNRNLSAVIDLAETELRSLGALLVYPFLLFGKLNICNHY